MVKSNSRSNQKALIVEIIAEKTGLTPNEIYKVVRGDRDNDGVMDDYVSLNLGINKLKKKVLELVPFYEPLKQKVN